MNTSREVFEKVECKEECYGIFCTAHPDKLDTCKKYINYLEEQSALMLEALKTEYKIKYFGTFRYQKNILKNFKFEHLGKIWQMYLCAYRL